MKSGEFSLALASYCLECQDIDAAELFCSDIGSVRCKLAVDGPRLFRYKLPNSGFVGIILMSRIGEAILSPVPFRTGAQWVNKYLEDASFYRNFVKDLQMLGFKSGTTDNSFFGPFDSFGQYLSGRKKNFRPVGRGWALARRMVGTVLPADLASGEVSFWESEIFSAGRRAFTVAIEGDELIECAPRRYFGVGRLIAMPAAHIRESSVAEKDKMLRDLDCLSGSWCDEMVLTGSYLDFSRGGIGFGLSGPLAPSDDYEWMLAEKRLDCVGRFACKNFQWSLEHIIAGAFEVGEAVDRVLRLVKRCEDILGDICGLGDAEDSARGTGTGRSQVAEIEDTQETARGTSAG